MVAEESETREAEAEEPGIRDRPPIRIGEEHNRSKNPDEERWPSFHQCLPDFTKKVGDRRMPHAIVWVIAHTFILHPQKK